MPRPARGKYPCKVCPEVLESPGALGGHMSAHRRRGELDVVDEVDHFEVRRDRPWLINGQGRLAADAALDEILASERAGGLNPLWIPVITALATVLVGALVLLFVLVTS